MGKKLTIGMATYNDFHGVYFTLQALRLYHPEAIQHCEIIIVDTAPANGPHSEAIRNLVAGWMAGSVQYVHAGDHAGTASSRDLIFRLATTPAVLVLDCHVFLPPGTLRQLIHWYDLHPESKDLYSGPIMWDDLRSTATHFNRVWSDLMLGKWASAWYHPQDVRYVTFAPMPDGNTAVLNLEQTKEIDRLKIPFHGHESQVRSFGYEPPSGPFEIPAMGLGMFSCRRDAWQGFHPEFSAFGGEEWYIHEKFRRAGAKCICLPWLKWLHRFGRPEGTPYPAALVDRARNYIIGHREFGWDLRPVYEHFVLGKGVRAELPKLSEAEWKEALEGKPKAKCGCEGEKQESLDSWYEKAANTPSDINEHVPTLREFASKVDHVTEFGMRAGVSTVAILAAQPKRFVTYDINRSAEIPHLDRLKGECDFEFRQGDSRTVEIEETDMLFVDTKHTAEHLWKELKNTISKVRRFIVLHDTVIFGRVGEDGSPGLMAAVSRLTQEHREWTVIRHDGNNNGLTILSRDQQDKTKPPGIVQKGINFAKALANHVADGMAKVDPDTLRIRLDICNLCEFRNDEVCGLCGCVLTEKASWRSSVCPTAKWNQDKTAETVKEAA